MGCSKPGFPVLYHLRSLLKLMSIGLVMTSNHLILCHLSSCLHSFPASEYFPMSWLFASGSQSIAKPDIPLATCILRWEFFKTVDILGSDSMSSARIGLGQEKSLGPSSTGMSLCFRIKMAPVVLYYTSTRPSSHFVVWSLVVLRNIPRMLPALNSPQLPTHRQRISVL